MKRLILFLILGFFTITGFSQQVIPALDIILKDRIVNYDNDTLIAPFSGSGNRFMNVRRAVDSLDAVNLLQMQDSISASISEGIFWSRTGNYLYPKTIGDSVGIGTASPQYELDVVGSIRTDSAFYGDYWVSATGNSMYIQPTDDTDDFFSFKTPADRPTIKREGGKFVYFESSNVYDVGISFRADNTYSGTLNYEKDNHMMTVLGKNSPFGFKANSDYDDYIKIQTTSNVPEITTVGAANLKINADGNDLLLNHNGGNVNIGSTGTITTSGQISNGSDSLISADVVYDYIDTETDYFEKVLTDAENNIDVGFDLSSTSLVFLNGTAILNTKWSGESTQIINLSLGTKLYDNLIVRK